MGDVDRYVVWVSSKGIDVNLHRKDMETSFMTGVALYSTKHPWTLKTCIELSEGSIMKTDEQSRAWLGFIRGFIFSNNFKVCNDPGQGFLTNSQMNWGMHGQRKIVSSRKEVVQSYSRSTQ